MFVTRVNVRGENRRAANYCVTKVCKLSYSKISMFYDLFHVVQLYNIFRREYIIEISCFQLRNNFSNIVLARKLHRFERSSIIILSNLRVKSTEYNLILQMPTRPWNIFRPLPMKRELKSIHDTSSGTNNRIFNRSKITNYPSITPTNPNHVSAATNPRILLVKHKRFHDGPTSGNKRFVKSNADPPGLSSE